MQPTASWDPGRMGLELFVAALPNVEGPLVHLHAQAVTLGMVTFLSEICFTPPSGLETILKPTHCN